MVSIGTRLSWSRAASAWCLAVVVLFLAQGAASRLLAQGAQDYIVCPSSDDLRQGGA